MTLLCSMTSICLIYNELPYKQSHLHDIILLSVLFSFQSGDDYSGSLFLVDFEEKINQSSL